MFVSGWVQNSKGMQWSNLKDENNGLRTVMLILLIQWFVFMLLNFYLDGVVASASGISKHPLFFLNFRRKGNKNKLAISSSSNLTSFRKFSRNFSGSSSAVVHMSSEDKLVSERPDVAREVRLISFSHHVHRETPDLKFLSNWKLRTFCN